MNSEVSRAGAPLDLDALQLPWGLRAQQFSLMTADYMVRMLLGRSASGSPLFRAKKANMASLQAASGLNVDCPPENIPTLEAEQITPALFHQASADFRNPVVIRGLLKDCVAVRTWTREQLAERMGDHQFVVGVVDEHTCRTGWDTGMPMRPMAFRDFLARMDNERIYLNNSTEMTIAFPELVDELGRELLMSQLVGPTGGWDPLAASQCFIGSKNVYQDLHCAPGGNFFVQVAGRKRWTLFHPRFSPLVHPLPMCPFQFSSSALGGYKHHELVSPGQDNFLNHIPRYQVTLNPGDVLFNAPWWWHEVHNLDDFTIGSAVRWMPTPPQSCTSWGNNFGFTALSVYPFMRAMAWAHRARQLLTGNQAPISDVFNQVVRQLVRQGLGKADDAHQDEASKTPR